jgi:hypothetical protein
MFSIFKSKAKKSHNNASKNQSMKVLPDMQSPQVIQILTLDNYYLISPFKILF